MRFLARNWWALALRGLVAVVFGLLAIVWPGLTLHVLVLFFGAYVLIDGVFALIAAFSGNVERMHWWSLLLEGIAGIVAGVLTFVWPGITAVVLLYLIAAWALVTGVFEILAAIRLREEIEGEVMLGLGGLASIIFGIVLFVFPISGALAIVWLIGIYAIIFGVTLIVLALRLRSHGELTV